MKTFNEITQIVTTELEKVSWEKEPKGLYAPIGYVLSMGGKRIRPALTLMACNLYQEDVLPAVNTALGIEIFHNFTLLHDDIMDRADVRRGKPTVHKKWNDNTAILSGDSMLVLAYERMAQCAPKHLKSVLDVFTETALEIGEGQQYDMEFESRIDVTEDEYIEMIRLKTSVLLACALKIGAILADASEEDEENLYRYGEQVGLAFQLQDDLLDVYGDPSVFGKKIGGDILSNKKTYMLINAHALANTDQRLELNGWLETKDYDPQEKIKAVTAIYDQIGIRALAEKRINFHFEKSEQYINMVSVDSDRKKYLRDFVASLMDRKS